VSCRLTPSSTAEAQISTWVSADSGRTQFTLSEIQDLSAWTALHVFAPYTPTSTIQQKLRFEWPDVKRFSLDARNDIHLAVFVSGTNVVRVEEWGRGRFDCSPGLAGQVLLPSAIIRIDRGKAVPTLTLAEPDGPANGSQPSRSETNPTSAAAGSRR
jgi:hypothetical protein